MARESVHISGVGYYGEIPYMGNARIHGYGQGNRDAPLLASLVSPNWQSFCESLWDGPVIVPALSTKVRDWTEAMVHKYLELTNQDRVSLLQAERERNERLATRGFVITEGRIVSRVFSLAKQANLA
ncbi:MAG TPA: hypothetical protein VJ860_18130 [Polyangia bacterium]|nr:hypothetical protein [Polyangia bacterium]